MSAWLGGIAVLVFALRAATAELEPDARTPLLAGVVGRFSALATIALPLLILSGVVQSIVEVGSFARAARQRVRARRADQDRASRSRSSCSASSTASGCCRRCAGATTPGRTGVLLRRTLRAELALGLVAIAVTGALSSYAPSVAESSGPYATTRQRRPGAGRGHRRPGQGRPQPAPPLPVRRQDRRAVRADRGADRQRRDAREADRQDRALAARRRPRPLRRRRRQPRRGGRVDDPHRHPRLRLRPVRDPLHGADLHDAQDRSHRRAGRGRSSRPPPHRPTSRSSPTPRPPGSSPGSTCASRTSATTPPRPRSTCSCPTASRRPPTSRSRAGRSKVTSGPLDTPIQTDDGEITEGVKQITWTADSDEDGIPPGAFQDFGLSVPGPRQGRRQARVQGAPDLRRRRGRALDRRRGLRQPGRDRHRRRARRAPTPRRTAAATLRGRAPAAATPGGHDRAAASDDDSGNGLAIVALIVGVARPGRRRGRPARRPPR